MHEELLLIVPLQHPWAGRGSVPRAWQKDLALLGGDRGTGTGRLLQDYLGKDVSGIKVSMQLGSTEAVKHAVQAGLGISVVMAAAVEQERRNGRLAAVRIEGEPPCKTIYLVRRESEPQGSPTVRFIDFLLGYASSTDLAVQGKEQ